MTKTLPKEITSYDLLKTFAVITMIVDHIGVYFFPEEMWWRAGGRLSAPVWLFLIGYAKSRDLSPRLWGGAVILLLASFFIAPAFFPMNILFGVLVVRLILDRVASYMFSGAEGMIVSLFVLTLVLLPTYILFDYGSLCLVMALFGYAVRWQGSRPLLTVQGVKTYAVAASLLYVLATLVFFDCDRYQSYFVVGGLLAVCFVLYRFKPVSLPNLTKTLPPFAVFLLHICGRRTLEIYVLHLLIFKLMAYGLGIEGFGLFEWSWL